MKWLSSLLLILPIAAHAAVGSITVHNGPPAEIQRQKQKIEAGKGTGVEMNDSIVTAKTSLGITFQDKTQVKITEQSKLVIDDFVYDPKAGTGKLAMNVALGTVRYASGSIAKNSRENVNIKTPTATISVRGTDFSMTVDETGKSLVVLLPTCPDPKKPDECWVGSIEVATDVGYVLLNQAFQATTVNSANQRPSEPKIMELNESLINNLLIISPPRPVEGSAKANDNAAKENWLDKDLLEYKQLSENLLEVEQLKFTELDVNRLDVDYLDNMLDVTGRSLDVDELAVDPVLPTINRYRWIQHAYNEEIIFLNSERPPHVANLIVGRGTDGFANINQDGVEANIQYNNGGTNVVFNIVQTQ